MPVTLACLDLAGTTVADDGVVEAAFLEALHTCGVGPGDPRLPAMRAYVHSTMGTSKISVFRVLLGDEAAARTANAAFEAAYGARVERGEVAALPGAAETIAALRAARVKVALLTGFAAATRDRLIAALAWEDLADCLLCPAEAGRGRPYPDMVLTAVLRCEVDDVREVTVVGDTAADMVAGRRAGAGNVIGVLTGSDDADRLRDAGATHVLGGVAELPGLLGIA